MPTDNDSEPEAQIAVPEPELLQRRSRRMRLRAWAGTFGDLERLEAKAQQYLDAAMIEDQRGWSDFAKGYNPQYYAAKTKAFHKNGDEFSARAKNVFTEITEAEVDGITVGNLPTPEDVPRVGVLLGRALTGEGAEVVYVEGTNPQWVAGTFEEMSRAAALGRPRSWWLRTLPAKAVATGVIATTLYLTSEVALGHLIIHWVLLALSILWGYNFADWGLAYFAPRFEVMKPGQKDAFSRRIGVVIATVLALLALTGFSLRDVLMR